MKNKKEDEMYCGVREGRIKNASPDINGKNMEILYRWIEERYKIHLRKDVKEEKYPWTENEILKKYKFCNVRREHDKQSKWLIENISLNKNLNYSNKLLNTVLFRIFNKYKTIEIFGLIDFGDVNWKNIECSIDSFQGKDYNFFTNAFLTSGIKNAIKSYFPDENLVLGAIKLVDKFKSEGMVDELKKAKKQSDIFKILKKKKGLGDFLAYQIFVDFTYIPSFPFSENEFVVAGPGCKKGLDLIFDDFDSMSYEEALFWIRNNQHNIFKEFGYNPNKLFSDLAENDRELNVMSLENIMCEFSKYYRILRDGGKTRLYGK